MNIRTEEAYAKLCRRRLELIYREVHSRSVIQGLDGRINRLDKLLTEWRLR